MDGIYEILSPADIKQWSFGFETGEEINVKVGFFSIGEADLSMFVASLEIEFELFRRNFTQTTIGATKSWEFAVPITGEYDFSLSLNEIMRFAIAVYVKIETTGFIRNAYTVNAGPEKTPLLEARIFTSDNGSNCGFIVTLNHDTLYWFSATVLTPFDSRYPEQGQMKVWAYLEDVFTGTSHAVAAGGDLEGDILRWRSSWFGISKGHPYFLVVTIVANETYRCGIGLSIAEYRMSGDSTPDDEEEPSPNPFLSFENDIILGVVVGGIVIVVAVISKFSRRSVETGARTVNR